MTDITNPQHYTRLTPEPIAVIEEWGLSFHLGNAVKYIARAGHKQGADDDDDLAKAAWYIERERARRARIRRFIDEAEPTSGVEVGLAEVEGARAGIEEVE